MYKRPGSWDISSIAGTSMVAKANRARRRIAPEAFSALRNRVVPHFFVQRTKDNDIAAEI
jgi:hypothetical protein